MRPDPQGESPGPIDPATGQQTRPGPNSAALPAAVWRAARLDTSRIASIPSEYPALDTQLPGGGWPLGMLTELITREPGIGELRFLVPLLRRLSREHKVVILLGPPHAPYAPALASFGIDLDYLIIIDAPQAADRLWAVEQTLKSASFGALLAWLPQARTRPEHLRRMQLAAQAAQGPVFLFRELAAQFESSPAPLRLLLLPRPNAQLSVQLLKRRGPVLARPLLLELPHPPSAIRPRPSPVAVPDTRAPLRTAHAAAPGQPCTTEATPEPPPEPVTTASGRRLRTRTRNRSTQRTPLLG